MNVKNRLLDTSAIYTFLCKGVVTNGGASIGTNLEDIDLPLSEIL